MFVEEVKETMQSLPLRVTDTPVALFTVCEHVESPAATVAAWAGRGEVIPTMSGAMSAATKNR